MDDNMVQGVAILLAFLAFLAVIAGMMVADWWRYNAQEALGESKVEEFRFRLRQYGCAVDCPGFDPRGAMLAEMVEGVSLDEHLWPWDATYASALAGFRYVNGYARLPLGSGHV